MLCLLFSFFARLPVSCTFLLESLFLVQDCKQALLIHCWLVSSPVVTSISPTKVISSYDSAITLTLNAAAPTGSKGSSRSLFLSVLGWLLLSDVCVLCQLLCLFASVHFLFCSSACLVAVVYIPGGHAWRMWDNDSCCFGLFIVLIAICWLLLIQFCFATTRAFCFHLCFVSILSFDLNSVQLAPNSVAAFGISVGWYCIHDFSHVVHHNWPNIWTRVFALSLRFSGLDFTASDTFDQFRFIAFRLTFSKWALWAFCLLS